MIENKIAGYYRIQIIKKSDKSIRLDTGWFKNLITNTGLKRISQVSTPVGAGWRGSNYNPIFGDQIILGTGSIAPEYGDLGIPKATAVHVSNLNGSETGVGGLDVETGVSVTAPFYGYFRTKIVTDFTGSFSEIGFGWESGLYGSYETIHPTQGPVDSDFRCFSRSLVRDADGNPTSLDVLSDELLSVTYEIRNYAQTNDVVSSITLNGVPTTITTRAARASGQYWAIKPEKYNGSRHDKFYLGNSTTYFYEVGINNDITGEPQGVATNINDSSASITTNPTSSFVGGSAYDNLNLTVVQDQEYSINPEYGNLATGIHSVMIHRCDITNSNWVLGGAYQINFNPSIPKLVDWNFKFKVRYVYKRA